MVLAVLYTKIAFICLKLNAFEESMGFCDKALALDFDNWETFHCQSQIYLSLDNAEYYVNSADENAVKLLAATRQCVLNQL